MANGKRNGKTLFAKSIAFLNVQKYKHRDDATVVLQGCMAAI